MHNLGLGRNRLWTEITAAAHNLVRISSLAAVVT